MNNEKVSKEEVAKAMEELGLKSGRPSIAKIRAKLKKGSNTTILALRKEIETEARAAADCQDALKVFRELWAQAQDKAKKQHEDMVAAVDEDLKGICAENERLEGLASGAEERIAVLLQEKASAEAALIKAIEQGKQEVRQANEQLLKASEQARSALEQLTREQNEHAAELSGLRSELHQALKTTHALELETVRLQTLLDPHQKGKGGAN